MIRGNTVKTISVNVPLKNSEEKYLTGERTKTKLPSLLKLRTAYEGVPKSFRIGHMEREMSQLSATRRSCIAIL
jgi:hypothetical protein